MEWKTYTMEECDRFNGATGILGRVISICGRILYNEVKTEEEKNAVLDFEDTYMIMRAKITMEDTDKIDWIYNEVQPLILGDNPKLTLDYILKHTNTWENLLKAV